VSIELVLFLCYNYLMKEALFYQKLSGGLIECQLCNQFCKIRKGQKGFCGVRENKDGNLYSLVYGKIIAINVDPIEKKPLYHFLPKTDTFSIATVGCNFSCAHCQNADISQVGREGVFFEKKEIPGQDLKPDQIIGLAKKANCPSISYTYTEPTIFFEFAFDCMKLAKEENLSNIWVSNGYTSRPALEAVKPYLNAVNIDLKFFKDLTYKKICRARLQPVIDNLVWYKKNDIHLEITTLIIPSLNDSTEELSKIADFIFNKLGSDVPWHVSAFWPTYKLNYLPPTPKETVLMAKEIGVKTGLKNVYVGNI